MVADFAFVAAVAFAPPGDCAAFATGLDAVAVSAAVAITPAGELAAVVFPGVEEEIGAEAAVDLVVPRPPVERTSGLIATASAPRLPAGDVAVADSIGRAEPPSNRAGGFARPVFEMASISAGSSGMTGSATGSGVAGAFRVEWS